MEELNTITPAGLKIVTHGETVGYASPNINNRRAVE